MTKDFELNDRFSNLPALDFTEFNGRFGRLDALASWIVATKVPRRDRDAWNWQLIHLGEDRHAGPTSLFPTGIVRSQSQQSNASSVDNEIAVGMEIADRAIDSGVGLLLLSSPETTTPLELEILVGALTRTDAASVAPRIGVGDSEWIANVTLIRDGMFLLRDRLSKPEELLAHTKSFAIAASVGVILQAAKRATPVLLIGEGASCAALIATRISHRTREWTMPAVDLVSQVGVITQRHLDRPPIIELGITFENDYMTPLAMTAPIIDAVLALLTT
ncbi:MAG TPA: nicotinate-nucleotide--dimethylbenzimidazole phosphoribosyltransferase [Candidatus Nanopelagicaceae bacterium]|nr:nicotinate-nucleotide--dimethylbenzimidazole phosphoribosyltransferase [Candidatus Nanopelagicaceae bacterium]